MSKEVLPSYGNDELRRRVVRAVFAAIDQVNEMLPYELHLGKDPATAILAEGSSLDSMGFVNLIAAVEEEVSRELGGSVSLVESSTDNRARFATVHALVDHVLTIVKRGKQGLSE